MDTHEGNTYDGGVAGLRPPRQKPDSGKTQGKFRRKGTKSASRLLTLV